MNKDDREIYEAYNVQHEGLGTMLGKGIDAAAAATGRGVKKVGAAVGKKIDAGGKTIRSAAKAGKIPGAKSMYKTSQSDRYKDTPFGQAMGAVNQAGKGKWKDAAAGMFNAYNAYKTYNKNKASKEAAAKRAELRGEDPNQPTPTPAQPAPATPAQAAPATPAQPATPSASKSTTVQSPSQKQATAKKKASPKSTSVAHTVKPSVPKNEGTKGTKSDRERADVDGDGEIEDWEKAKANAIRKSQGKKHLCAKVVNHESFGPGSCIHAEHAIPDVDGNIEWYMVEFKHGTEKIQTADVDVVLAVEHVHD